MKKKVLVVNADDYGLYGKITSAVIRAIDAGIVTSASVSATSSEWREAVRLLLARPVISIGVHLNLTDGRPCSSPAGLGALVAKGGFFKGSHSRAAVIISTQPRLITAIASEFRAQIEQLLSVGVTPTHLDSHGHLHMLPSIFGVVVGLAQEFQIPFVRMPNQPCLSPAGVLCPLPATLRALTRLAQPKLLRTNLKSCAQFFAIDRRAPSTQTIEMLCRHLGSGVSELSVHLADDRGTGRSGRWHKNLEALLACPFRKILNDHDISLMSFHEALKIQQ